MADDIQTGAIGDWTKVSRSGPTPFSLWEYALDAWQRSVLFLDVLRERGNIHLEHIAQEVPNVLNSKFKTELVCDGRTLPRPVNYGLVRIIPPEDTPADPDKRPFVIVDPRAGHGPGIGGMKAESQIGDVVEARSPCYFVGFLPEPTPSQTVEDVCVAEAAFVEIVARLHPQAEGKPVVIANCQAGWQIMMMAATRPDLPGPILLAGTPLSYWAGVHGKNPLRYLGGMLGGTWITALLGDLGYGKFDGANLVANFERMNPANTLWKKPYNVYENVDSEAARFLGFETWWGSPVLLNATEMQWITDNLFVGNKLTAGTLRTSDGLRIDLKNIKSPIIVFCSKGDDITPPQQALDWIIDLYSDEQEIELSGQTIVYTLHESVGHLGIFVSGKVASKEHDEFVSSMDMIDLMPPGLYEAVITDVDANTKNTDLIHGRYLFRLERRTLDDIRALGGNDLEDNRRFATVARVSDIGVSLYEALAAPTVRKMTTEASAEMLRQLHPLRLRFTAFSDRNPASHGIKALAEQARTHRRPANPQNPFLAAERSASSWISTCLEAWGNLRDIATESLFLSLYGSPVLQAAVGLGPQSRSEPQDLARDLLRLSEADRLRAKLEERYEAGGPLEAALRALAYIRAPEGGADERSFAMARAMRAETPRKERIPAARLKETLKEQALLVAFDEARAIRTLPRILPQGKDARDMVLKRLRSMIDASGTMGAEGGRRMAEIDAIINGSAQVQAERQQVDG
jgi:hypothetical protein